MEESKTKEEKLKEYNNEPVVYCKHCLSLRVMVIDNDLNQNYCDECGSTNVDTTDIYTWEKLYKAKYGKNIIER